MMKNKSKGVMVGSHAADGLLPSHFPRSLASFAARLGGLEMHGKRRGDMVVELGYLCLV